MKLFYKILFIFFGERIIFSSSSQPWPNNQHFNAYQYIYIRACFFTWGKARGVPDGDHLQTRFSCLAGNGFKILFKTFVCLFKIDILVS
jgi:hypothetical protein